MVVITRGISGGFLLGGFKITGVVSGSGCHGIVFLCRDRNESLFAMKVERNRKDMRNDNLALSDIMAHPSIRLAEDLHIPRLRKAFRANSREILVMELLGPDLQTLWNVCGETFSCKTIIQIGLSLLTAYEQLHNAGWLHLTTKPENFCIGGTSATRHKVYLVDFGRAEKYALTDEDERPNHRPNRKTGYPCCLELYLSPNLENGDTPSRRDDLLALGLMLLRFSGTERPWAKMGFAGKAEWLTYLDMKEQPDAFESIITHCQQIGYDEEPNYEHLRDYLRRCAKANNIELDGKFDWDEYLEENRTGRVVLKDT